ncbi:MAG: putative ABC transporter permease [Eubacteriales bacterium]
MKTRNCAIVMVMVVVSFLGFCIENVFTFFCSGTMNNRNMILPFLFGYGMAILALFALFGTPDAPLFFGHKLEFAKTSQSVLYYFAVAFTCVCVGEVVLGYATEWICGIKWWDYSNIPLHITQYTSVPTSMAFAGLIVFFMKFLWNPMIDKFSQMNPKTLTVLAVSFAAALSLDMINSAIYMLTNNKTLVLWEIKASRPLSEILIRALS